MTRQNHELNADGSSDRLQNELDTASSGIGKPIVGIGASAGGLEALKIFLENVPEKSGMTCIVVQHLDPTREGMLVELLTPVTTMTVQQVNEDVVVMPDNVYIIPPNKDLQLFHGRLHLFEPSVPRGLRLPIDFLFQSIAADQKNYGIGVILSGMGSDGTLGLKSIKEKGGAAFVQDPLQAKFNGMPNSAIHAGVADEVDLVENLPSRILAWWDKHGRMTFPNQNEAGLDKAAYQEFIILLHTETGHDFSHYKETAIHRRVERRMSLHRIDSLEKYVRFLRDNPQEIQLLYKEILIGVTSFFRDPETWDALKEKILPDLIAKHDSKKVIRAWVVGCSTGEEAYSLGIIIQEAMELLDKDVSFQIFASDPNIDALAIGRKGIYPSSIQADVSEDRLKKYFVEDEFGYRVHMNIRSKIVFASQNVSMDPPFTKIDIICCRNLFIYLRSELQKRLLGVFHFSLNPEGILVLGNAETIDMDSEIFEIIDIKAHIYRKLISARSDRALRLQAYPLPRKLTESKPSSPQKLYKAAESLEVLADRIILEKYAPAAVLVNSKGDILYTKGKTGRYLEPAAGKANWNIFAMVHKGLYHKLYTNFHKAILKGISVIAKNVVLGINEGKEALDLIIYPLKEPESLQGLVMIVFTNTRLIPKAKNPSTDKTTSTNSQRTFESENELRRARQELATLYGEVQSAYEEYNAAYEELQSFNEELQSTTEEMTTSKEELQSLNEELQTVNDELRMKVGELTEANNDMKNLLDSTNIATLFLDKDLRIRRFTPQTALVFRLIPEDVGRPIFDIVSQLEYPMLSNDIEGVLAKGISIEKQIHTGNNLWYRVRIMPYRTVENIMTGVTITFFDITEYKVLEDSLRKFQSEGDQQIT